METATKNVDPAILKKAKSWLSDSYDEETAHEVRNMIEHDPEALVEAFYKDLEFGTGGLRGIMGVGSNRINIYTIAMATQGLSNYLKKQFSSRKKIKVAVAYDSRNNSKLFARRTAEVFSANGFQVYLFEDLRPTPELSFTIRHFGCQSGVVITASHNPKEYNGYKAYWEDGGQLISPHDKNVIEEVQKIKSIDDVLTVPKEENIKIIGTNIDKLYIEKLVSLSLSREAIRQQRDLRIVFTPLHGTSIKSVPYALTAYGFTNINVVEEQAVIDGNFPTVKSPNPEEASALDMALKLAKEINADLVLGTDPDADRVGIAVKNNEGEFTLLNGNQTGSLIVYYLLKRWQELGKITGNEFIAKTIVTTELMDVMAQKFGVECYNVLTGFKYIADIIKKFEEKKEFIGGGEESYGYLAGSFVRDKDAVMSCALIAEATAWAMNSGKSLYDKLIDIYREFGFYQERLVSMTREGKAGAEEIAKMMENLRNNPPAALNGSDVIIKKDYQSGVTTDLRSGKTTPIELPKSNVLQFYLADGSKITARPSGTEPKIKFYFSVNSKLKSKKEFENVRQKLEQRIDKIIEDLGIK